MHSCPFCGAKTPDDAVTCEACGAPVERSEHTAAPPGPNGTEAPSASATVAGGLAACPQCKEAWKPGAIICVACGYDSRIGRRHATVFGVEEDRPIQRSTVGAEPVRAGLVLHGVRVGLFLLSIVLAVLGAVLGIQIRAVPGEQGASPPSGVPVVAAVVVSLAAVGLVAAQSVLGVFGSINCLWAPREAKARRWVVASLLFDIAAFAAACGILGFACRDVPSLNLGSANSSAAEKMADWPLWLAMAFLPIVAAWFLFMLFAGRMAWYCECRDERSQTLGIIVIGLLVFLAAPLVVIPGLLWVVPTLATDILGAMIAYMLMAVVGIVWFLGGSWVLLQVIALLTALRRALLPKT